MTGSWNACKSILVIRPDNMGDLLMSTPAIRALKETFGCRITVLTSSMAQGIARHIAEIDDVLVCDVPWVQTANAGSNEDFSALTEQLHKRGFDAAVIFTVYSQNPMPSILLAWLAGIPLRLAWCRENPYHLLTDWAPDPEPYTTIRHQVKRDLDLVARVGAFASGEDLSLSFPDKQNSLLPGKLAAAGVDPERPWLVFHAGVSEEKRAFPQQEWIKAARQIVHGSGYQVLFTGSGSERQLTGYLSRESGSGAFSLGGVLTLEEFMLLLKQAPLVVSVNTGTIHIAAATGTPMVVLYAMTNPQHAPWRSRGVLLPYDVPEELRSKNEIIRYVRDVLHPESFPPVTAASVVAAVSQVLSGNLPGIPELLPLRRPA